jgi:pyridoxamine 5'-phosphate oxidase
MDAQYQTVNRDKNLDDVLDEIWMRWGRGRADRRSPLHTPAVATTGDDGAPQQRTMVVRAVERQQRLLRFHTDTRSGKFAQSGRAAVLGYDPGAKMQLRMSGDAEFATHGPAADSAWASASPSSRRAYLVDPGPGTIITDPGSGLAPSLEGRAPDLSESEAGRTNFAVMLFVADRIDWLHLAASGHRRAQFMWTGAEWEGQWVVP